VAGEWLTAEEQRVWRDYLALHSRLQAAMNRQLQGDCGLSLADYEILVALSERGELRIFQLLDTLGWQQSRLSHQLSRMRARNLVERRGGEHDKRGATVTITDVGESALRTAAPGHVALVRQVFFDGMTPAQLRTLHAVTCTALERLAESAD
jgi:DNA-binding MarR family transcriptional regulator